MWAETTKDGKVKFREQYKDPLTGKYKKVSVTYDKNTNQTRRKAQIALEQKIQSKLRNIQDGSAISMPINAIKAIKPLAY